MRLVAPGGGAEGGAGKRVGSGRGWGRERWGREEGGARKRVGEEVGQQGFQQGGFPGTVRLSAVQ